MRNRTCPAVIACAFLILCAARAIGAEALARADVAKLVKPATALVDARPAGQGSAFCIHSSGLFISNAHVVEGVNDNGGVKLVLDSGTPTQRSVVGRVLQRDKELDLAVIQALGGGVFPALELGSDENLGELAELFAFGFPFGIQLGNQGEYPSVSVNAVNVSALRRNAKRELERIQVDSNLNPGNSGGPVVDRNGKVVGVVVSGIPGRGINNLIPVSHVRRFVDRPIISFELPKVTTLNKHEPAEFRAGATILIGDAKELEAELVLGASGAGERHIPMKLLAGRFIATAIPCPDEQVAWNISVEVKYPDGSVNGMAKDQPLKIGADTFQLSQLRSFKPGPPASVWLSDGRNVQGAPSLDSLTVQLGGHTLTLPLAGATELRASNAVDEASLRCVVVVRKAGQEVGRSEQSLRLERARRPTLEAILESKFIKPETSRVPVSYLKAISTPGEPVGQGKTFAYKETDLTIRSSRGVINVRVDGWTIEFAPPRGKTLAVGEYANAKRTPFNNDVPGVDFSGHGRSSNSIGGDFVIWELQMEDDRVVSLAVDFMLRSEAKGPPLYGMLRYKSSFQ